VKVARTVSQRGGGDNTVRLCVLSLPPRRWLRFFSRTMGWRFQPRNCSKMDGGRRPLGSVPACVSRSAILSHRRLAAVPFSSKAWAMNGQDTALCKARSLGCGGASVRGHRPEAKRCQRA
jgi:hypothetical protein